MLGAIQIIGDLCQSSFNAGFLTHLYLIRTEEVVFTNSPGGESIIQGHDSIAILPGSIIVELLIKPKTAVFSETKSESVDGDAYQVSLSVPMKGSVPGLTNWVHRNEKRRYVILTRDTLGNCYLIGSPENGARMGWSRQVGSVSSHQLSFNATGWHPIQFIPTIDLDELFPDGEFDESFDLSFS